MPKDFIQCAYRPEGGDRGQETLFCRQHKVEFCTVSSPPKAEEILVLDAAKQVAGGHMEHYGCDVVEIKPDIKL